MRFLSPLSLSPRSFYLAQFSLLVGLVTIGMLAGCDPKQEVPPEPVDPALKNTLSNTYCLSEDTVSLICGEIPNYSADASYRLQVAQNDSFDQLIVDEPINAATFTYPSRLTGSHAWRIIETGTNPKVVLGKSVKLVNFYNDDDNDGLSNGLEMNGLLKWDLPALGLDYQRQDIVVYMDTMNASYPPSEDGFGQIIDVFANSPVKNPNGETGINMVLVAGKVVPLDTNLEPVQTEFNAIKQEYFPKELLGIAHYMIWAYGHSNSTSSGYSFGIPASDFVVTLGSWGGSATDDAKVGTFIHELGHNLGLRHGGKTDQINSPNYLSVMNYDFQIQGVIKDGERVFDYQRIETEPLNEGNLNELLGIGPQAAEQGYGTVYRCTTDGGRFKVTILSVADGIDWNCDGALSTGVAANIDTSVNTPTLIAQNDWANLNLAAIRASSEGGVSQILPGPKELTLEQFESFLKLEERNK